MGSNATVALFCDGDRESNEFLELGGQRTFGEGSLMQLSKTGVHVRNGMTQISR
jgi:hypothetical protein